MQQFAEQDLPLPDGLTITGAQECNALAWEYITGPERQRDPQKALVLNRKAMKLTPEEWKWFNTQGLIHYRLGQYSQAMEWLEKSLHEGKGQSAAYDLFFLAMCHLKLGAAAQAKDCYEQAVRWVKEHPDELLPDDYQDLITIEAEAEGVLVRK